MSWLTAVDRLPDRFVPGARIAVVAATDGFVVVDKPAGLLTVPGRGPERADCVEAQVRALLPDSAVITAVHRLDLETSGLVVVALQRDAVVRWTRAFEERRVAKTYIAVIGVPPEETSGTIDAPIGADIRPRFRVAADGRAARTRWVHHGDGRLTLSPETGRTHQLRLHCALARASGGLGAPILGDTLYGDADSAPRLLLHAAVLSLDGQVWESPTPF